MPNPSFKRDCAKAQPLNFTLGIMRKILASLSNRAKWLAYLAASAAYGICFGELWQRYLQFKLLGLPVAITKFTFIVGLFVPMLILGLRSITYYDKSREEQGKGIAKTEIPYLKLWRGEETLSKAFFGFCTISTLLVTMAGQKLILHVTNAISSELILLWVGFIMVLVFHLIVAVGTWRSASRYSGAIAWSWLARIGVSLSFVSLSLGLILGAFGHNVFAL